VGGTNIVAVAGLRNVRGVGFVNRGQAEPCHPGALNPSDVSVTAQMARIKRAPVQASIAWSYSACPPLWTALGRPSHCPIEEGRRLDLNPVSGLEHRSGSRGAPVADCLRISKSCTFEHNGPCTATYTPHEEGK